MEETGFFERGAEPPKIGTSEEMPKVLSALSEKNPYAETHIFLNGKYFILRLKGKKEIEPAQFDSQKENYRRSLLLQKQETILMNWLGELLEQAKAKGQVKKPREPREVVDEEFKGSPVLGSWVRRGWGRHPSRPNSTPDVGAIIYAPPIFPFSFFGPGIHPGGCWPFGFPSGPIAHRPLWWILAAFRHFFLDPRSYTNSCPNISRAMTRR